MSVEHARWYFDKLLPLLSPSRRPSEPELRRDIAILSKGPLRKESQDDVLLAVKEARRQANFGKLPGFIAPGQAFTLRALLYQGQGPTNYTGFLCEARKRQEKRTSQTVADIFAAIAARGRAEP